MGFYKNFDLFHNTFDLFQNSFDLLPHSFERRYLTFSTVPFQLFLTMVSKKNNLFHAALTF